MLLTATCASTVHETARAAAPELAVGCCLLSEQVIFAECIGCAIAIGEGHARQFANEATLMSADVNHTYATLKLTRGRGFPMG